MNNKYIFLYMFVSIFIFTTNNTINAKAETKVIKLNIKSSNKRSLKAKQTSRVRIAVKLTGFKRDFVSRNGKQFYVSKRQKALTQVLRARKDETNHFFIKNFHIETKPLRKSTNAKAYSIRLKIYEKFGALGRVEKLLGEQIIHGTLKKQARDLYQFWGYSSKTFRDKLGNPVLMTEIGIKPRVNSNPISRTSNQKKRRVNR